VVGKTLLHQPKVIFLDEPTAGLDPLIQQKFFNLIREENKNGATIFFSSHILSVVQKICNRVAIIREGEIVEIQDIRTLQKDNYKKIKIVADDIDEKRFDMDGVTNLEKSDGTVSFFYRGDINVITKIISANTVSDVSIEEPTLEEIFMHYYE
jgi:ABC-2 type transport system ATP-binding protein